MSAPTITAKDVSALRQKTGAGMMDCKKALTEAGGDPDKAFELLKIAMGKKLDKLADRDAPEGTIATYLHATGKVGAIVEIDCNTDFVAKNEDFTEFAREIAMHIAGTPGVKYVSDEDVPQEAKDAELRVFIARLEEEGKPEQIREKIAQGQLGKWLEGTVLLRQTHINEGKHESRTIDQMREQIAAKTGENVVVRRFTRFAVGE